MGTATKALIALTSMTCAVLAGATPAAAEENLFLSGATPAAAENLFFADFLAGADASLMAEEITPADPQCGMALAVRGPLHPAIPALTGTYLAAGQDADSGADGTRRTEGSDFLIDLRPMSLLFSPDMDGFTATRLDGFLVEMERIEGIASWMPTIQAGTSLYTEAASIDLTVGGGALLNGGFVSPLVSADATIHFYLGDKVAIGPHLGVMYFLAPQWLEDAELDFSGTVGFSAGISIIIETGLEGLTFVGSADYLDARFDVTGRNDWLPSSSELDVSGIAAQMGLLLRL